ncbi:hypothetical protein MSG28_001539 [Choristoneura fumiferana]|uniref:Uncharacterized protein n=1 Tax=Choristoneura fumiferana TaxID=7141 RepID=A0ACC0KVD6_CHOFU|nr:hypothetical protein MSG28_001539 [Choristoneura fumiferana]
MSSDEHQVQNIYRYYRKSYNKNRRGTQDTDFNSHEETNDVPENSPRSEAYTVDSPRCSCDLDREGDIANILHKKCPVITLAQQQLVRLLDETNRIVVDNNRHWSLGQFNSPILNCIDNYFVPDAYISIEDTYRSIA